MARIGITLENVKQAKEAILAREESVSIDAVRAELGHTGSKSTIHRHLKHLSADDENVPTELLLSEELQQLLNHVAARLKKEAHETLVEREIAFDKALDDQQARVTRLSVQNDTLQAQSEQLSNDVDALNQDVTDITAERDNANRQCGLNEQRIASLTKEVQLLTTHNQSLEDKHVDARASLEHYRASVASQRERDTSQYESTIAQLNHQQRELTQRHTSQETIIQTLNVEHTRLEVTLAQELQQRKQLDTQNALQEKTLEYYRDNNQRLEQTLDRLEQASEKLRSDLASANEDLNTRTIALDVINKQLVAANAIANTQERLIAEYMHGTRTEHRQDKGDSVS
jgi:chromosome segregation ATPase